MQRRSFFGALAGAVVGLRSTLAMARSVAKPEAEPPLLISFPAGLPDDFPIQPGAIYTSLPSVTWRLLKNGVVK